MVDVRCKNCNRYLLKAAILVAAIKCHRCGMVFEYQVYSNIHLTNAADPEATKKYLQSLKQNDNISAESQETAAD